MGRLVDPYLSLEGLKLISKLVYFVLKGTNVSQRRAVGPSAKAKKLDKSAYGLS